MRACGKREREGEGERHRARAESGEQAKAKWGASIAFARECERERVEGTGHYKDAENERKKCIAIKRTIIWRFTVGRSSRVGWWWWWRRSLLFFLSRLAFLLPFSLSFAQHATSGLSSQTALLFLLASTPGFFAVPLPFFVKRPTTRTAKTTTTQCNNTLFSLIILIIIGIPRAEATSISSCRTDTGTQCMFTYGALCSISTFGWLFRARQLRSDRPVKHAQ